MTSGTAILDARNETKILAKLDKACLRDGRLDPMPAAFYATVPQNDLSIFCVRRGFYCLPTVELIEWLRERIGGRKAIEIGAGNGAIGRALGIPMTDSRQQERPEMAAYYASLGQATVSYPDDVEKLSAAAAVEKYKPEVVIAAWVTHRYYTHSHELGGNQWGVDESRLRVATYIHVGHEGVHAQKPILKREHETHRLPFLYSRSMTLKNVVWVWTR